MQLSHLNHPFLLAALAFLGLTFASFTSCSKTAEQQVAITENIIVPGLGVGSIQLGMSVAEIIDSQGKGSAHSFENDKAYTHSIRYNNIGITVYFEPSATKEIEDSLEVIRIELNPSFVGQTLEGISIGSLNQEVRDTYGRPDAIDYPIEKYNEGIAYIYPYGNKIGTIVIEAAWEDKSR